MRWVPNLQLWWHFDEKATAARRARVKNTRNFRKITAPHMRTRLSTPNLCRKQLQGNATPANPHFLRVLTRFAHIVPPSSRSIFTEIQDKSAQCTSMATYRGYFVTFDFGLERWPCPNFWYTGITLSIEGKPYVKNQRLWPCGTWFFQGAKFGRFSLFFDIFRSFSIFFDRIHTGKRSKTFGVVCGKD